MNPINSILFAENDYYSFFAESFLQFSPLLKVTIEKNGNKCINRLKDEHKPDVIFLDLNKPFKNALKCSKHIINDGSLTHIPVAIYFTSHYRKHIDACFEPKAQNFFGKPTDVRQLTNLLNIITDRLTEILLPSNKENFVLRTTTAINL